MVTVHCPRCNSDEVYQHGRSCSQHERFRCYAAMGSRGPDSADTVSTVRQPSLRSADRSDFYTGSRPFLYDSSPVIE